MQRALLWLLACVVQCASGSGLWNWAHRGDVRAVLQVPATLAGHHIAATVEWRRRDQQLAQKRVLVTDSADNVIPSHAPVVEEHQGVLVFEPPVAGLYYVYWLPYTQSGEGHIDFKWDAPDDSNTKWVDAGNWSAAKGTAAPQIFQLQHPCSSDTFRLQIPSSFGGFQSCIREFSVQIIDKSGHAMWLPNSAKAMDQRPVSGSSGWQPNVGVGGMPWEAMDGNSSTIWDPTVYTNAWLDLTYPSPITIQAISVRSQGDTTHDATRFVLQHRNNTRPAPYPDWRTLPALPQSAILLQARNAFESFMPMELSASVNETSSVVAAAGHDAPYLVFTQNRSNPVRMQDRLPHLWVERVLSDSSALSTPRFEGNLIRGDYFTFQVAVFVPAHQAALHNVGVSFSGFEADIASSMTCFNSGGINAQGDPFVSEVSVQPSQVKSLWIGFKVPDALTVGSKVTGTVVLSSTNTAPTNVQVTLTVSDAPAVVDPTSMDSDPTNYTRLRWLNSKLSQDDEIVAPFIPVNVLQNEHTPLRLSLLNRVLEVGADGLITRITVTRPASAHAVLPQKSMELLASGLTISLVLPDSSVVKLQASSKLPTVVRNGAGKVSWWAMSTGLVAQSKVTANVSMSLELDGYIEAAITLSVCAAGGADTPTTLALADVVVGLTLSKQHGQAWMGLDHTAEPVTSNVSDILWKWSMVKRSSAVWVGSAEAGLRVHLKGADKDWNSPALDASLPAPKEWGAAGAGGCNVTADGLTNEVRIAAYTGKTSLNSSADGKLVLHLDMSVTPFKTANQSQHWSLRHYQVGYPTSTFTSAADVKAAGANVINIHQGVQTMINPYINYPFVPESVTLLQNYTNEANAMGMRVKFYYTVRELSTHAAEIWALRMLGDEIFKTDNTCGYGSALECPGTAWQRLHLGGNFSTAWVSPLSDGEFDAAIGQEGLAGRWLNYYIEGLRQSVQAAPHIDGIYFDGILFDRATMQRVRKTIERYSSANAEGGLIDFHTGNDFITGDDIVDAVVYMNHWAYVDSLWIGEGFSYDSPPVFWLAEMSGLPFGAFSDMLGTPNPYRGMLFGSTGRPGCTDPKGMWSFWDKFGINETDMVGWWLQETPVRVLNGADPFGGNDEVVLATSYVMPGEKTLVAIASWAPNAVQVTLTFNWTMLGLDPSSVKTVSAPAIDNFQKAASWPIGATFVVEPARGWLLVIEPS